MQRHARPPRRCGAVGNLGMLLPVFTGLFMCWASHMCGNPTWNRTRHDVRCMLPCAEAHSCERLEHVGVWCCASAWCEPGSPLKEC